MAGSDFDNAFQSLFAVAFRVARRIVANTATAEDVAAETMTRAYVHWRKIGDAEYREAWVARVATNLSLNVVRRRPPVPDRTHPTHETDLLTDGVVLTDALRRLPRRQREALVLRHVLGYSEPEIADRLGLGLGTVKTHLRRGYETMRRHLGEPHPDLALVPEADERT